MIKIKIYILVLLVFTAGLIAQSEFTEQFKFAKDLFEEEQYFDSITEFKRLLYFDESDEYNFEANFLIAESYKQGAKYSDAVLFFTRAELYAATQEEINNVRIQIIRSNILRRTTARALKLIDSLQSSGNYNLKQNELNYWRGWSYIFANDWENASKSFSLIDSCKELSELCLQVENDKYSVGLAKALSYLLPGAGQFYTGEYLSGLLSLGWNVLWGYLTIKAFVDDRIFDGFIIGSLLWMRFYRGNFQNAEKFAVEKNLQVSNKALLYLQNEFNGLKP